MEKYVNRSTGVLLQPAQESVAAMLAPHPMWAIWTHAPEPAPEPEPSRTRKGKASKEE